MTQATTNDLRSAALRDKAVAAKEAIADLAVEAKSYATDRLSNIKSRAGEQMTSTRQNVTEFIRHRPYQALAIAAGAGLLLGLILKRR